MELDNETLKDGKRFIVGTWQAEYVVSAFSNNLEHIPASEFKSDDGRDFSSFSFEFFEDNSLIMRDTSAGKEEKGTWEQTGNYNYRYTLKSFFDLPDGEFKESAEKLEVIDGRLVFNIGFLAVALHKTAEGFITKEPDIGDMEGGDGDVLVGRYEVAKAISVINGEMGLFGKEDVVASVEAQIASGEISESERGEALELFDTLVELTADHRVLMWHKIPGGISEEEIDAALKSGDIDEVRDGMFRRGSNEWKEVGGKYYWNTGAEFELFDEKQSPWELLEPDKDGLIPFSSGMMKLRRI